MTVLMNLVTSIIVCGLILIFNNQLSRLFTKDEEVVAIVKDVLWVTIAYIFLDGIHGVYSGIIRGLGKQSSASIFTLVCYYIFGLPLALFMALKLKTGIWGLWMSFTIASFILDVGFVYIV